MEACGAPASGAGPWRVDLRARLIEEARRLGLTSVTASSWCSAHDRPTFYSYRASGGADGRMVAYIGLPPASGSASAAAAIDGRALPR